MGGPSPGMECIFPFKHKGVTHHACKPPPESGWDHWCSTRVDNNGEHVGDWNDWESTDWGDCSQDCPKEFDLNLTHIQPTDLDLANHLWALHKIRKQHGIIFVGIEGHSSVLRMLATIVPAIFSSDCPLFMPSEYRDELELRLDSNIVFYKAQPVSKFQLIDSFAVKGGPIISEIMGHWDKVNGINFLSSKNRWNRRTDLKGALFVNGFNFGNPNWAEFIRDDGGKIVGSQGFFQYLLFYMTDRLNVTMKTVEYGRRSMKLENGTWTGPKGAILRREVDVHSVGSGIVIESLRFVDFPLPTNRIAMTLMAARPQGTSPNMWVYTQVFEGPQWALFTCSLIILIITLSIATGHQKENIIMSFGTKRGNEPHYKLNSVLSAFSLGSLYVLQMGSHPNNTNQIATKVLTLTLSVLTFMFFMFYTSDITSKMTSGPGDIPVRNFEDVIHHGYRVVVFNNFLKMLLDQSEPGSARYKVYKKYIENQELDDGRGVGEDAVEAMMSDEKTLLYAGVTSIQGMSLDTIRQLVILNMDDTSYAIGSFALPKHSEFLQMFNHYILKELEHGINKMIYRRYHPHFYTNEHFGLPEPLPLGYQNVLFPFIFLGLGSVASLAIALVEFMNKKCHRKKKSVVRA